MVTLSALAQEAEEKQRNVINKRMTAPKAFPRVALDLATTVERIQQNFVICDPNLPDCPIVFASDGFIELTEYPRHEILGRNCRYIAVMVHCIYDTYQTSTQIGCVTGRAHSQRQLLQHQQHTFTQQLPFKRMQALHAKSF